MKKKLSAMVCVFILVSACGQSDSNLSDSTNEESESINLMMSDFNSLVPALGFSPGDPSRTEDRVGPTGVLIPGRCPPTQQAVNNQVALRNPQFPRGIDLESRIQRFEKTLSALQDLRCPAASTTLLGRLKSLTALRSDPNKDAIVRGLGFNETPADRQ